MPELPEVQTVAEALAQKLAGRRITSAQVNRPRLIAPADPAAFAREIRGARIEAVTRRAKFIRIELDRARTLLAHLRMTGHLAVSPAGQPLPRFASAVFALDNVTQPGDMGSRLVFEDARGLGTLRLLARTDADALLRPLGMEPLSRAFTARRIFQMTRGRGSPLKVFLMDQRHIAGLGNIYAAEALWRARLDPRATAASLARGGAARLHRAIVAVLREAVASARKQYRRPGGLRAEEEFPFAVYQRESEACPRCAWPIRRVVQGGRSTFFCSRCQRHT